MIEVEGLEGEMYLIPLRKLELFEQLLDEAGTAEFGTEDYLYSHDRFHYHFDQFLT